MTLYNLVFQGQIQDKASINKVKDNLARLFKADDSKIAQLFSGKAIVIKKNLDAAAAKKYLKILATAGARAKAVKIDSGPVDNEPAGAKDACQEQLQSSAGLSSGLTSLLNYNQHCESETESLTPATADLDAQAQDSELVLVPANTGVIPNLPRHATVEVPDIAHLSMSPAQSGSLEEYTEIVIPAIIPDTDHISLNAPNSGSLEEFTQPVAALDIPDISSIKLAEQDDARALSDASTKPSPVDIPDSDNLSLAEANEDGNEELAKKAAPLQLPDTSHLHLKALEQSVEGKAIFKIDQG